MSKSDGRLNAITLKKLRPGMHADGRASISTCRSRVLARGFCGRQYAASERKSDWAGWRRNHLPMRGRRRPNSAHVRRRERTS